MPSIISRYSSEEREVAAAAIASHQGDLKKAAKWLRMPVRVLRAIVRESESAQADAPSAALVQAAAGRPRPSDDLACDERWPTLFAPDTQAAAWIRDCWISEAGPLYNPDHCHLAGFGIALLWTNATNAKAGRDIVGTCQLPKLGGGSDRWAKARSDYQLEQGFGDVPDVLITIDAVYASQCSDAAFCALIEHELYHAGHAVDHWGEPRFDMDGNPILSMRGHDVEEFVGVVARYGAGAASSGTAALVHAGQFPPSIADVKISAACGVCLR
ncbi:MAG: hypothetical protein KGL39_44780 [Patescibacteria group bacterium]|nr:hypothetical protein [Patescibacteria group bacterium]